MRSKHYIGKLKSAKQALRSLALRRTKCSIVGNVAQYKYSKSYQIIVPGSTTSVETSSKHLLLGALQDVLLDGAAGQEAVDVDRLRLPDPVRPAHRLQVVLRVPAGACGRREVRQSRALDLGVT